MKRVVTKKGISLVALVVTIIVLIILTGAVVATFMEGGIIDRAKQAVIQNDIKTYQEILITKKLANQIELDTGTGIGEIEFYGKTAEEIQKFIPEFKEEYEGIIELRNGEIIEGTKLYKTENEFSQEALLGVGIIEIEEYELEFANILADNGFVYSNGYITGIKTNGGENGLVWEEETITTLEDLVGTENIDQYRVEHSDSNCYVPYLTTGDKIYDKNNKFLGTVIVYGDIDGSGWFDSDDYMYVLDVIEYGKQHMTIENLIAMDVNGDGYITEKDCDYIMEKITAEEADVDLTESIQIQTVGRKDIEINIDKDKLIK